MDFAVLEEEDNDNQTLLMFAIRLDDVNTVRTLLELDVAVSEDLDAVVSDASDDMKQLVRQRNEKTVRIEKSYFPVFVPIPKT
jgi:hypothetical protein